MVAVHFWEEVRGIVGFSEVSCLSEKLGDLERRRLELGETSEGKALTVKEVEFTAPTHI